MSELLGFFILCFSSLFAIVNPFSTAIVFETLSVGLNKKRKKDIALKSAIIAFIVLVTFALSGFIVLNFFSITTYALKIGGGIYLIALSLRMLDPLRLQKELHPRSKQELKKSEDIAIVPLAIPLLSGPGAITTTIVLSNQSQRILGGIVLIAAIAIVCILSYLILSKAYIIKKFFKSSGLKTIEKVMGLIILCIGVQFILNGIKDYIALML